MITSKYEDTEIGQITIDVDMLINYLTSLNNRVQDDYRKNMSEYRLGTVAILQEIFSFLDHLNIDKPNQQLHQSTNNNYNEK